MNNMIFKRKLPIPKEIKERYPISPEMAQIKQQRAAEIRDIFTGADDRLILVIGPCSADNPEAVLDYIGRMRRLQDRVADKIFIIPRIYTNKPRTTGDGYKGLLHQPNPEEKPDMLSGIVAIRSLHMRALKELGFTCADEMLYPDNHRYLNDLLAYVAVGARSVENQEHRLTASGLDVPVGMKNPTGGDLHVMMNSVTAAQHPHMFIYRGWEVETKGNPLAHSILRGYIDASGKSVSNYHYEDLMNLRALYDAAGLQNPAVVVDTNHANSGKQYLEQIRIAKNVVDSCNQNADLKKLVKGLMIESYIEDGAQKIGEHCYGKSITDPCLGWKKTERLVLDLAEMRK